MDENNSYLSDNDEKIYEMELDDNLIETQEQLHIREWKLKELETIIQHTEKNTKTRVSSGRLSVSVVDNFAKNLQYALSLSRIPVYNTIDDYIISLPLPDDNKDFNDAMAVLRTQADQRSNASVLLICPIKNCTYKSTRLSDSKQHVIGRHFKLDRFECKLCHLKYKDDATMVRHITNKHLNGVRILCNTCQQTFCDIASKEKHLSLGHVEPIGQPVFRSYTPRKIVMDVFKPDDVKKSSGFSYQIYVIPWVNDKNELYDISVGFTKFLEVTKCAAAIWYRVEHECKNLFDDTYKPTQWLLHTCGSVRREYLAGNKMNPEESFSLELYAVSSAVATQLKWFVRQYFDSIRILGTEESKFYLEPHNDWLKNHLVQFLPRLPLKTQKHVAEFGPSFGFENLAN